MTSEDKEIIRELKYKTRFYTEAESEFYRIDSLIEKLGRVSTADRKTLRQIRERFHQYVSDLPVKEDIGSRIEMNKILRDNISAFVIQNTDLTPEHPRYKITFFIISLCSSAYLFYAAVWLYKEFGHGETSTLFTAAVAFFVIAAIAGLVGGLKYAHRMSSIKTKLR